MQHLIQRYKNLRKQNYLKLDYSGKYAFVGIGNHSINNLYPVLNYLRLPLKYIVTQGEKNAKIIDQCFPGIDGTNNLDQVLADKEIRGIFICTNPQSHYGLVKKALEAGKNVFVEKPPCLSSDELQNLVEVEEKSGKICLTGLQKRYAPAVATLKKEISKNKIISYNYRFITGNYPEGDSLLDIFIHPINLITYLFGNTSTTSIQIPENSRKGKDSSIFLHLNHGSYVGNIELSTNYSWSRAEENLSINTQNGIYEMKNLDSLSYEKKQGQIFSIPMEKIKASCPEIKILFGRNNFNPIIANNQLFTSGYYEELNNFIQLCEGKKGRNYSSLATLIPTYELINQIKQKHV